MKISVGNLVFELFESVLRMKLGWAGKWQVSVYIVGEEVVYQCDRGGLTPHLILDGPDSGKAINRKETGVRMKEGHLFFPVPHTSVTLIDHLFP
jgi:hypothetical protein